MRLGIRLQLLLALGALLVLAFVPLYFAVASLTRASFAQVRATSATALGRAVAGHVTARAASLRERREELGPLLDAQLGPEGVSAIGVYTREGRLSLARGERAMTGLLPATTAPLTERTESVQTSYGAALLVVVPGEEDLDVSSVGVVVRIDRATTPGNQLVRIVALYTGSVALGLLVFAYIAMTRLVVQPVDNLSRAARRVADGARTLEVPRTGASELLALGASLAEMTGKLVADEAALRAKVAEVEQYAQDLARAQERLVRSERLASVGRLAAGLAHEIGNPIAAILGFQELLLAGGLEPDEQLDFLARMRRETERIHRILRDLLDFARPAVSDDARPLEEAGDLREALDDAVALTKPQRAFREITLTTDLPPDLPRVVLSQSRIVQVLLNLLLNAADAAPQGTIVVRARLTPDASRLRVEVEDDGPGIAPEILSKLFEPFVTTKPVGEGTGLGLAVCRGLVEAVGGSITVEPVDPHGARFVIELGARPT